MLVASAGFWSLVMVRQSRHAPNYPSFPLGTYKVRLGAEASLPTQMTGKREKLCACWVPLTIWTLALALNRGFSQIAPAICALAEG